MSSRIVAFIFLSTLLISTQSEINRDSTLEEFFSNKAEEVNNFIEDQLSRVKQVVQSTYIGIDSDQVRNNIDNYFNLQENRLANQVNEYIEKLKTSDTHVLKIWSSFVPTEDPVSRLENPELDLSVPAIIGRNGYHCETHTVVSEGYVLNVHRIPRPKNGRTVSKNAVILQHGLFDSSYGWIINGPEKSLAYVLADAGYDVWLTNVRGNIYAREHAWYKTKTKEFWNFSFHDIAKYDMPAVIDYIKNVKGNATKISYIGHSMGNTILAAMLSLRPDYNDKLSAGIAFAPSVFFSNMKSPIKSVKNYASDVAKTAMRMHFYEVLHKDFLSRMTSNCYNEIGHLFCKNVLFYIMGEDEDQLNHTLLSNYLLKGSSASWKTVLHYIQLINSGKFQQFDYGISEFNTLMYGQKTAPEYDLSNVRLNITLFWAQNDLICNEKDVRLLHDRLPNSQMYLVPYPKFNHVDYIWAKDAPTLVNAKVLEILKEVMEDG